MKKILTLMMLLGWLPMMTFAKEGKIKYNNVIYKGNVENGKPSGQGELYYKGDKTPFLKGLFNGMNINADYFNFGLSYKGEMEITPVTDKSSTYLMRFTLTDGVIDKLYNGKLLKEIKFASYGNPKLPTYDLYPNSIHLVRNDETKKETTYFWGVIQSKTDVSIRIDSIVGENNGGYTMIPKGNKTWEIQYNNGNTYIVDKTNGEDEIRSFTVETPEYSVSADNVSKVKISSDNIALRSPNDSKGFHSNDINSLNIPENTLILGEIKFKNGDSYKGYFAYVGEIIGFVTGTETKNRQFKIGSNGIPDFDDFLDDNKSTKYQWKDGKNITEIVENGGSAILESTIVLGSELTSNASKIYEDKYKDAPWRNKGYRNYTGPITKEFTDYDVYENNPIRIRPGLGPLEWSREVFRMTGKRPESLVNSVVPDNESTSRPSILKGKIIDKNGEFTGYFTADGKYAYGDYKYKDGRIDKWQNMVNLSEEERAKIEAERQLQLKKEQEMRDLKKTLIGQTYYGSVWGPMGTNTITVKFKFLDAKRVKMTSRYIYLLEPQNEIQRQYLKKQEKENNHDYTLNYVYENGKVIFGPNNDVIQFSDKDHATFYEVNLERKE